MDFQSSSAPSQGTPISAWPSAPASPPEASRLAPSQAVAGCWKGVPKIGFKPKKTIQNNTKTKKSYPS